MAEVNNINNDGLGARLAVFALTWIGGFCLGISFAWHYICNCQG
jgi:hypothetical protein